MGARLTPYEAASREQVDMLDVDGVAMVCMSYLDIAGTPAHLRYLMQRMRRKLPKGTPILVGLWPAEEAVLTDERVRKLLGADHYATSLAEAVTTCLEAAGATASQPVPA